MPCRAMQSRMELCGAGRGHAGPCEHIRGHVGRQHGNSAIRRCLVGPRGGKMKNDFSRLILSRAGLTPARDKISLEKWLIGWAYRIALGVVLPTGTPTGYSSPAPGCCGASIATGTARAPCRMPSSATRRRPRLALVPTRRLPGTPHDPLGRLPAYTRSHRHTRAGVECLRGAGRRWGTVRCGAGGCDSVRESGARFEFVTGGPVPPPARWKPTGRDGFATQNATARARHRA